MHYLHFGEGIKRIFLQIQYSCVLNLVHISGDRQYSCTTLETIMYRFTRWHRIPNLLNFQIKSLGEITFLQHSTPSSGFWATDKGSKDANRSKPTKRGRILHKGHVSPTTTLPPNIRYTLFKTKEKKIPLTCVYTLEY